MEPNSALASLTANYTDSEPEEDSDDGRRGEAIIISAAPSASNSPSSLEGPQQAPGSKVPSPLASKDPKKKKKKKSRLVSYQDDQIDDEEDVEDSSDEDEDEEENNLEENIGDNVLMDTTGVEENEMSKSRIKLPPEPLGKCSTELQEKIRAMLERKQRSGLDFNEHIQSNKAFRNPSIYEKLIKYCDLDELGTNYPPDKYDPHEWKESSFYDELAKTQKVEMEKREKERKERTKVEFVSTVRSNQQGNSQTETEKKKSKWDQRGVMPPLLAMAAPSQVIPPPTIATTSTGTKSTIINAFGNPLPKKSSTKL